MIPEIAPVEQRPFGAGFIHAVRHPVLAIRGMVGDHPVAPLLILFGLNAVDELDRNAFSVLLPTIQDDLGVSLDTLGAVLGVIVAGGLLLQIPVAHLADRQNRIRLMVVGAVIWSFFSLGTAMVANIWLLGMMRAGSGLGKSVIEPTHNSLLADFYPVELRPRIYSFHRSANTVGLAVGGLLGGLLGGAFGWRAPFLVFIVPTVVLVALATRLVEPTRGAQERRAMGASEEVVATEETPPSLAEAWRMVQKVQSLRRIYSALPFLVPALVGFGLLSSLKYESLGLDEESRGLVQFVTEPFGLIGFFLGARLGMKVLQRNIGGMLRLVGLAATAAAGFALLFAFAPADPALTFGSLRLPLVAVVANVGISISLAIVAPGVFASLSLGLPPRARAVGFSVGALYALPGAFVMLFVGSIGEVFGIEWGLAVMTPVFVIGGLVIASAHRLLPGDVADVWNATAARSELLVERRAGRSPLLMVRKLNVAYGDVQILFDVDFEVDEGEVVALLGTNGAGKSTLLKAICGVVEADRGAVIFDGRDVTHAPPYEIAAMGVAQVPGGQGVFPGLTVQENLRAATWLCRRDKHLAVARIDEVLGTFPVLRDRLDDPAANLSGGQQQMLALGMAFIAQPRLLLIDELSLGLAPVVVEQLVDIVRRTAAAGTTVIVVEQSVNVALTLAEKAYFMEKGEIRFSGPTGDLLDRPDVLRSVFLEGAGRTLAGVGGDEGREDAAHPMATAAPVVAPVAAAAVAAAGASNSNHGDRVALEVRGLWVRFGGIRAVDDVSFTVAPGEIVGLIGPNGAGKTTLLDLISGFTPAGGGAVVLGGRDVTGLSADARARQGLGRSFQDARLFPSLTVEETIKVALERWVGVRDPFNAVLRLPAQQDAEVAAQWYADRLIDLLGIESFRTKFVAELSTGSRRVVDLACVLAHRPSVVLLDEPSSGIAQRETEALGPLLLRIRDQLGASLVVIEHDMPLITSVSDRLVALDQGRVVTIGGPADVLVHPDVVASYLGGSPDLIARSGDRGAGAALTTDQEVGT